MPAKAPELVKGDIGNVVAFLEAVKRAVPERFDDAIDNLCGFLSHVAESDACTELLFAAMAKPVEAKEPAEKQRKWQ